MNKACEKAQTNEDDTDTVQFELLHSQESSPVIDGDKVITSADDVKIEYELVSPDLSGIHHDLDNGSSYVVLFATFMAFLVLGGCVYTTGVVHSILLERFGENNAVTAWAASLFSALSSLAGPLSSFLIDRYSCRTAVIVSGVLLALGFVGTVFAPNIYVAIVTFGLLAGVGVGCGYIAVFTAPGFNFHRKLNLAMGLANSGVGFGIFIVGPMIELARENHGPSGCFFILAAFAFHNVLFGALMRPSSLELKTLKLKRTRGRNHHTLGCSSLLIYLKICTDKCVIFLSLSLFFYSVGSFVIFIHLPNFTMYNGFSPLQAAFLISVSGVMLIACKLLTGIAANAEETDELTIYVGSMWTQVFVTFMLPLFGKWYAWLVVYAAVIGLYFGSCYVVLPSINKKTVGVENMASALGVEYFLGGIGSIIGPVIAGYILDKTGSYTLIFVSSAIFLLLGATFGLATVIFTEPQTYLSGSKKNGNIHMQENRNTFPRMESVNDKFLNSIGDESQT